MLNLNEGIIHQGCFTVRTYQAGYEYYLEDAVHKLEQREEKSFWAQVRGQFLYDVVITFSRNGELKYTDCDCPAFAKYPGYCKHIVATLFEILERQSLESRPATGSVQVGREMLALLEEEDGPETRRELQLEVSLDKRRTGIAVSMKIGEDRLYVLKDFREFFAAMASGQALYFGKQFTYEPRWHKFAPDDQALMDMLWEVYKLDAHLAGYGQPRLVHKKEVLLPESMLDKLLELLRHREFNLSVGNRYYGNVQVVEEEIPLQFALEGAQGDLALKVNGQDGLEFLDNQMNYVLHGGNVHKLTGKQAQGLRPVVYGLSYTKGDTILLPQDLREQFVSMLLPALKQAGEVEIAPSLEKDFYQHPLVAQVRLDGTAEEVSAQILYVYGEFEVNPFSPDPPDTGEKILVRDVKGEKNLMALLEQAGFTVRGGGLHLVGEDKVFALFAEYAPRLQHLAEVYYSDRLGRAANVQRPVPKGQVRISAGNLLEVDFELDGVSKEELAAVLGSLREKRKYHRLRDGSWLDLDQGGLAGMTGILEELEVKQNDLARGRVQVPAYRALALEHHLNDASMTSFRRHRSYRELVSKIREIDETEFELPAELEPVLRDYQKRGFAWLKTLAACNMGGILADEMGLGKTLQVIALLKSQLPLEAPALVVAPTSLLYNWRAEVQRFAPDLRVAIVAGNREERLQLLKQQDADVVVTSYALLRRDVEEYLDWEFSWCILDEAQYVKNPVSQTARAVKQLSARRRLALTGTPMENSLIELWSIFDFLMPGFLAGHKKFSQKYAKPIQEGDASRAAELSRKVAPFILRRLKKNVLKELPEKIEHTMLSELTWDQKKLYLAWLERIRTQAAAALAEDGFNRSRVKILAGLTRLRQICCHPSLFLEDYGGGSGKLEQLREVAADAVGSGHRLLVFSQFTSMLQMIRQRLEADGLNCFYLDGSTPAEKRLEYVHSFNRGEGDLFLISLKAGGTGLNLVGADTVIHYDLWWNPAVEDQASDRAHRIGQTRRVQVMKFVAMGTIDEKIHELQQKKKELIDKVIDPGETLLSTLSEAELREILNI